MLRGMKGSFGLTCASIRYIKEEMVRQGKSSPKACVHFVLTNQNIKDIPGLLEAMVDMDVRNFFVEPLVQVAFNSDTGDRLKVKDEHKVSLRATLKRAIAYCEKNHIETNLYNLMDTELIDSTNRMDELIARKREGSSSLLARVTCYEPWHNVIVRPNGRVGPCCMFDYSGEYLSNKTLREIWFGDFFSKTRENLLNGKLSGYCSRCNPSQVVDNEKIRRQLFQIPGGI